MLAKTLNGGGASELEGVLRVEMDLGVHDYSTHHNHQSWRPKRMEELSSSATSLTVRLLTLLAKHHTRQKLIRAIGVSEEQIIDTFGRVGSVNNFRLVHDKETGRPKGFGFLEFADPDAAASAVRNLNDHEIMGRKLRVDWSNDNSGGGGGNNNSNDNSNNNSMQSHANDSANQQPPMLPPLPPGTDLPAGLTCPDAISKTLSAIPAPQLLDIISQMKGLVMSDPNQATELLRQAPQLAYAIFQALLLLGLVDTSMLSSIVQASAPQNPQFPAGAPVPPPPMPQPPQAAYAPTPQPGYPGYPPQHYQQPTPPVQQPAFAPPPPPQQAAAASQQDLIAQVLSMTIDQINQLDPVSRQQIIALRAQLGAPVA